MEDRALYAVCRLPGGLAEPAAHGGPAVDVVCYDRSSALAYYDGLTGAEPPMPALLIVWHPLTGAVVLLSPSLDVRGRLGIATPSAHAEWLRRLCLGVADKCADVMDGKYGEWRWLGFVVTFG